jgi:hypothetical protein
VNLMILQMQFLLDVNAEFRTHATMLDIKLIANTHEVITATAKFIIQSRQKDEVMAIYLVEVDCLLYHMAIRLKTLLMFLDSHSGAI